MINALSEKYHPLQMLADYMTVKVSRRLVARMAGAVLTVDAFILQEHFGKLEGLTFSWVGDGNNVLHDYMLAAPKVGANIQIATPVGYEPDADVLAETKRLAKVFHCSMSVHTL